MKVLKLLLDLLVLLGHLLVLLLPLVAGGLESLDFAFVVAGFDVGLSKSAQKKVLLDPIEYVKGSTAYFSFVSLRFLSLSSASSSSSCKRRVRLSF